MNQTYFCDTSGVIKLYHQEIGTNVMVGSFLFVCADVNLNKICELEGIEVLNPELQGTS